MAKRFIMLDLLQICSISNRSFYLQFSNFVSIRCVDLLDLHFCVQKKPQLSSSKRWPENFQILHGSPRPDSKITAFKILVLYLSVQKRWESQKLIGNFSYVAEVQVLCNVLLKIICKPERFTKVNTVNPEYVCVITFIWGDSLLIFVKVACKSWF